MARTVTVTFDDDTQHVYENVPDTVTPDAVEQRAATQFQGKKLKSIDGGKFSQTEGGAATGNPGIQRQGERATRGTPALGEVAADIGGAAGIGGLLGAAGPEIMSGIGNAAGAFPATAPMRAPLMFMGNAIRAAGRPAAAAAGAISGAVGETAGQAVEAAGGGPTSAEIARIVGGGVGPELGNVAILTARTIGKVPVIADVLATLKKAAGRDVNLTAEQKAYVEQQIAGIRGPGGKTDAPLEAVGSIMGAEGQRLMSTADQQLIAAQQQAAGVKPTGAQSELADIGGNLRSTITARNEAALSARNAQFKDTEKARDALVAASEGQGRYVNSLPEYQKIIDSLKSQLDNTEAMRRSPDVQRSIQKVLGELQSSETIPGEKKLVQSGLNLDLQETPGKPKPTSFEAIDDVRKKLGEVFKGKPAEGYEAMNDARGRELYAQLTDLQKKFAGGENGPHAKLLSDYHAQSEELAQFRSKMGKKATALDQYREGEFATDPSALPSAYFKTRASVQALKELTGNPTQVNHAALEYANKQLAGKDAKGVNEWMQKNSEWLSEVGPTRSLVERYATKLQASEAATRNAEEFATQAAADSAMLTRNKLPAQRAVDLIQKGDAELWAKAAPAIAASPQAKQQMVNATRQVIADQATAKGTADLFSRNIRPFLESTGIATKAETDSIATRLANIQAMNVPESERLGLARRLLLQSTGGWAASAASRAGVGIGKSMANLVPD